MQLSRSSVAYFDAASLVMYSNGISRYVNDPVSIIVCISAAIQKRQSRERTTEKLRNSVTTAAVNAALGQTNKQKGSKACSVM